MLELSLQVLPHSQLIFPSKTWFLRIYSNFPWQKSLISAYLPHFESKSYQMNPVKSCSSSSFQQHQRHIPISSNFQLRLNLIFSEKIIQYPRTFGPQIQMSWNQAHAPLLIKSFPKTPRTWSEASQLMDLITTKQNKLPSFIDRSLFCFNILNNVDGREDILEEECVQSILEDLCCVSMVWHTH